ncbi:MAG: pro-sigmaK processing inhibitor BofA family protein [Bacillota bacterium]
MVLSYLVAAAVLLLLLYAVGLYLARPLKILWWLVTRLTLGAATLLLVNWLTGWLGFSYPFNWASTALVGFLGIPGFVLLTALKIAM